MSLLQHKRKLFILAVVFMVTVFAAAIGVNWVYAAACTGTPPFPDVPASNFACTDIQRILNLNITTGIAGNYLGDQNVTRYQMAAFLNRVTTANSDGTESYLFNLDHNGNVSPDGAAIRATSEDGNALYGISDGAGLADNGVEGITNSTSTAEAGVLGVNNGAGAGLIGLSSGTGTNNFGVRGGSTNTHGVYGDGGAGTNDYSGYFANGWGGVRGIAAAGYGVVGSSTGNDGVWGYSTSADSAQYGGYFNGTQRRGLFALGATNWYDGYFNGNLGIFVNGSCNGCSIATYAINAGSEDLQPGDVVAVSGVEAPLAPNLVHPTIQVAKADSANAGAVVGVVMGRYAAETVEQDIAEITTNEVEYVDPETGEVDIVMEDSLDVKMVEVDGGSLAAGEAAAPGDYVLIVYQGLVEVNVDASAGAISAGDALVASSSAGNAMSAKSLSAEDASQAVLNGAVLGKAMESVASGQDTIWVMVTLR